MLCLLTAFLEFVVYRDATVCLTAFCFSPFEVRDDSYPSGDGLSHLNRIKVGGAATVTDREVLPGCARVRTKCAGKTSVGLWGQSRDPRELPGVTTAGPEWPGCYILVHTGTSGEHTSDQCNFTAFSQSATWSPPYFNSSSVFTTMASLHY